MSGFWAEQRVAVTGGAGFIGSHVRRELERRGVGSLSVVRSARYDLTKASGAARMLDDLSPTVVFHLAGVGGGIAAHRAHPGFHFYANTAMALHVVEAARRHGGVKLVYVGSADSYAPDARVPTKETDLWNGDLEPNSAGYGVAKKIPIAMLDAYQREYGLRSVSLILTNVYGPGARFDPDVAHVIPAMIRRFDAAAREGTDGVVCWGSGEPTRDFLYVEDAARGIVDAAERIDDAVPINLGSGRETSIHALAEAVATLVGYRGEIRWDTSKPDGHPRRLLDITRARELLDFTPRVTLLDGLRETIDWWRAQQAGVATIPNS